MRISFRTSLLFFKSAIIFSFFKNIHFFFPLSNLLLFTIRYDIQVIILIILVIHITAIAEIVAFVYDYQVIVTPVDSFKINSV